ncbi:MAG: hypothetical protein U1G07_17780 [Verrucomicrobiota bacterium]
MNKRFASIIGPNNEGDVKTVPELVAALSPSDHKQLIGFARWRLRCASNARLLQQHAAHISPEDLVHDALLKVLLGDEHPDLGRQIKQQSRSSIESFLMTLKSIISSDISHLARDAAKAPQQVQLGDTEDESCAVDPTGGEELRTTLDRRDLHRLIFAELYRRIQKQPALLSVVKDWEERFLDDNRIGTFGQDANLVHRVRNLTREILADLEPDLVPLAA